MTDNISLNRIGTSDDYDLISLYENYGNTGENDDNDSPFQFGNGNCAYYEANEFSDVSKQVWDQLIITGYYGLLSVIQKSPDIYISFNYGVYGVYCIHACVIGIYV